MLSFLQPIMQRPNFNLPRTPAVGETGPLKCEKPSLSYQTLIARAIMSAGGSLTLAGIYSHIMDSHLYFRTTQDNWRNRVRHTLTVCKCFKRMATTSSRRGGLWTIDTEYRASFTSDWTYVGANNRPTQSSPLTSLDRPSALTGTRSCPTTPDTIRLNRMENPTTQLLLPTYNQDPFGQTNSAHTSPEISRAARLRAVCTAPDTYCSPGPDVTGDFWGDLNGDLDDFQDPLDILDHPFDANQPYPVNGFMGITLSGGNLSPTSQLRSNQAALLSKLDDIQHQRLHADDLRRQASPYSICPRNSAPAMVLHSATIDRLTVANQTAQAQEFTALAYQRFSFAEQADGGEDSMNLTADEANSLLSSYNEAIAAQQQQSQAICGENPLGITPITEEQAANLATLDIDFSMLSLSQLGGADGLAGLAMKQEPGSAGDLNAAMGAQNQGIGTPGISMFSMENLDPLEGLGFGMNRNLTNTSTNTKMNTRMAAGEDGSRPGSADLPDEEDTVGDLPVLQAFRLEGPKTDQSMENFNRVLSMLKSE